MLSPRPPGGPRPVGARVDRASLVGGSRGSRTDAWSTTQAWCFPLKEAAWRPVAPMLKARTNHASAALNGEIYAVGGKAPPRAPPLAGSSRNSPPGVPLNQTMRSKSRKPRRVSGPPISPFAIWISILQEWRMAGQRSGSFLGRQTLHFWGRRRRSARTPRPRQARAVINRRLPQTASSRPGCCHLLLFPLV